MRRLCVVCARPHKRQVRPDRATMRSCAAPANLQPVSFRRWRHGTNPPERLGRPSVPVAHSGQNPNRTYSLPSPKGPLPPHTCAYETRPPSSIRTGYDYGSMGFTPSICMCTAMQGTRQARSSMRWRRRGVQVPSTFTGPGRTEFDGQAQSCDVHHTGRHGIPCRCAAVRAEAKAPQSITRMAPRFAGLQYRCTAMSGDNTGCLAMRRNVKRRAQLRGTMGPRSCAVSERDVLCFRPLFPSLTPLLRMAKLDEDLEQCLRVCSAA